MSFSFDANAFGNAIKDWARDSLEDEMARRTAARAWFVRSDRVPDGFQMDVIGGEALSMDPARVIEKANIILASEPRPAAYNVTVTHASVPGVLAFLVADFAEFERMFAAEPWADGLTLDTDGLGFEVQAVTGGDETA